MNNPIWSALVLWILSIVYLSRMFTRLLNKYLQNIWSRYLIDFLLKVCAFKRARKKFIRPDKVLSMFWIRNNVYIASRDCQFSLILKWHFSDNFWASKKSVRASRFWMVLARLVGGLESLISRPGLGALFQPSLASNWKWCIVNTMYISTITFLSLLFLSVLNFYFFFNINLFYLTPCFTSFLFLIFWYYYRCNNYVFSKLHFSTDS